MIDDESAALFQTGPDWSYVVMPMRLWMRKRGLSGPRRALGAPTRLMRLMMEAKNNRPIADVPRINR